MKAAALTAIILGAGIASAQSISSGCLSTLTSLASNPEFACLNAQALAPLATNQAESIVAPVNTWLQGMCAQPACTNSVVSDAVSNITSGCSSELASLGLQTSSSALQLVTPVIQLAYPTARQVACLQDSTDGNTMCVTELLTNMQDTTGALTVNKIVQIASGVQVASSGISGLNVPANVTCSNCVKQAYNIVNKAYPAIASQASSALSSTCGASFVDGATPSGVVEIASTASAASTSANAALGRAAFVSSGGVFGIAVTSLVAVFSAFVVLA